MRLSFGNILNNSWPIYQEGFLFKIIKEFAFLVHFNFQLKTKQNEKTTFDCKKPV